jgi:hypothetical protein
MENWSLIVDPWIKKPTEHLQRTGFTLAIAPYYNIVEPACVIPDPSNDNKNSFLRVLPMSEWGGKCEDWFDQPHVRLFPDDDKTDMGDANNSAISCLITNGSYLYVGFDNSVNGVKMYRTNS